MPSRVMEGNCRRSGAVGRLTFTEPEERPGPAGQGASHVLDILFGVVADAKGEQFQQFAGVVLVGPGLAAPFQVEIGHHGGIERYRLQERAKVAQGMTAVGLVLLMERLRETVHLAGGGGEMAMPEQRHHLAQRRLGGNHLLEPPGSQVADLLSVAGAVAPQDDQVFLGAHVGPAPAAVDPHVAHPLGSERRRGGGLVEQGIDGLVERHGGQSGGLLGRATEAARLNRWRAAASSQAWPLTVSAARRRC